MEESVLAQLRRVRTRYDELTERMSQPDVAADYEQASKLAIERSEIEDIVELATQYDKLQDDIEAAHALLAEGDEELRELARAELEEAQAAQERVERKIRSALVPKDPRDDRNVITEIRSGAGGEEAALFAPTSTACTRATPSARAGLPRS